MKKSIKKSAVIFLIALLLAAVNFGIIEKIIWQKEAKAAEDSNLEKYNDEVKAKNELEKAKKKKEAIDKDPNTTPEQKKEAKANYELAQVESIRAKDALGTGAKGMITAGFGAMACAIRVPMALWQAPKEGAECTNDIIIALWKTVVFPMIKKTALNLVTSGDFGLTYEGIRDFFWKGLVFQTAEQVLNAAGLSLCITLSVQIKLALYKSAMPYTEPAECTFDQSEFAQLVDDFIKNPDAGAARLRRDFWGMFYLQTMPTNNQFGGYWLTKNDILEQVAQKQKDLEFELTFSNGFLGTRKNCKDRNGDGTVDPITECEVGTPGKLVGEMIMPKQEALENATWQAQSLADIGALTGALVDLVVNNALEGAFSDVKGWISSNKEDAQRDYLKALEKEAKQAQSATGDNKIIDFPNKDGNYKLTPGQ